MNNLSETTATAGENNMSIYKFVNATQHGSDAVFWIVVDALLLVAIVTGNSLSVAIILRTGRRRQRNMKSNISESIHLTHTTSAVRKRNSNAERVNSSENENPDTTPNQSCRPGTRSSCRFVLSLAISDLLVGLSMPFHMVFYIQGADGGGSPLLSGEEDITLGQIEWTCLLRFVLIALACSASACNLLAIAVDRYLAIVYPLHYCRYMTKKVAITMIISCWGTALILATVPAYWNRWKTATLCELDDIFTPEYITCVVAPLFSAVVVALSILYWRIGKEARAQLKRLLGADGKGPPWRRCQNGKTYSSSTSVSDGLGHNRIHDSLNTKENEEASKINDITASSKDERCQNGDHVLKNMHKQDKNNSSSGSIAKSFDGFKKNNRLPYLQEVDEEQYHEVNIKNSDNYFIEKRFNPLDQTKPNLLDEPKNLNKTSDKYKTVKETGKIIKCQSDPNLVSCFKEEVNEEKKGIQDLRGLNNQISCNSGVSKNKINSNHNHISPINNFSKENKNTAGIGLHKKQCGLQKIVKHAFSNHTAFTDTNFHEEKENKHTLMKQKFLTERKYADLISKPGTFNTMPKMLVANWKHLNKPSELIISVADFMKESNENMEKNASTSNGDTDSQDKSRTSKEDVIKKFQAEGSLEEDKQNNLSIDRPRRNSDHDAQQQMTSQTLTTGKVNCDISKHTNSADSTKNENSHVFLLNEEPKENEGIERRASCMRSISSCSSRGGRRNSTWNIRLPSLTSGNASIRPHISKSTVVVLLVLGSFILLWLPYLTVSSLLVKGVKLPYTLYRLTFSLAMSNSGINPIIYGWKNAELKRVFMRFLMNKWHRCTRKWIRREEQGPVAGTLTEFEQTEASCIS